MARYEGEPHNHYEIVGRRGREDWDAAYAGAINESATEDDAWEGIAQLERIYASEAEEDGETFEWSVRAEDAFLLLEDCRICTSDNDIAMVTVSDGHPDRVVKERHAYGPTGEPRGDGPRCFTCGDLGAWGTHPLCATDDRDRLLVSTTREED